MERHAPSHNYPTNQPHSLTRTPSMRPTPGWTNQATHDDPRLTNPGCGQAAVSCGRPGTELPGLQPSRSSVFQGRLGVAVTGGPQNRQPDSCKEVKNRSLFVSSIPSKHLKPEIQNFNNGLQGFTLNGHTSGSPMVESGNKRCTNGRAHNLTNVSRNQDLHARSGIGNSCKMSSLFNDRHCSSASDMVSQSASFSLLPSLQTTSNSFSPTPNMTSGFNCVSRFTQSRPHSARVSTTSSVPQQALTQREVMECFVDTPRLEKASGMYSSNLGLKENGLAIKSVFREPQPPPPRQVDWNHYKPVPSIASTTGASSNGSRSTALPISPTCHSNTESHCPGLPGADVPSFPSRFTSPVHSADVRTRKSRKRSHSISPSLSDLIRISPTSLAAYNYSLLSTSSGSPQQYPLGSFSHLCARNTNSPFFYNSMMQQSKGETSFNIEPSESSNWIEEIISNSCVAPQNDMPQIERCFMHAANTNGEAMNQFTDFQREFRDRSHISNSCIGLQNASQPCDSFRTRALMSQEEDHMLQPDTLSENQRQQTWFHSNLHNTYRSHVLSNSYSGHSHLIPPRHPGEGLSRNELSRQFLSSGLSPGLQGLHVEGPTLTSDQDCSSPMVSGKSESLSHFYTDETQLSPQTLLNSADGFEEDGPRPCRWNDCNLIFYKKSVLGNHLVKDHVDQRKDEDFICFWHNCPRQTHPFNARYKLLIHLRVHSGEKPYKCEFTGCPKAFSRLENLKIHCRSHTGEKPYGCQFQGCRKMFSNSSDRAKHEKTHAEERPYACQVVGCDKKYTDPSSLRKHMKTTHVKEILQLQQKKKLKKDSQKEEDLLNPCLTIQQLKPDLLPADVTDASHGKSPQSSAASADLFSGMIFANPMVNQVTTTSGLSQASTEQQPAANIINNMNKTSCGILEDIEDSLTDFPPVAASMFRYQSLPSMSQGAGGQHLHGSSYSGQYDSDMFMMSQDMRDPQATQQTRTPASQTYAGLNTCGMGAMQAARVMKLPDFDPDAFNLSLDDLVQPGFADVNSLSTLESLGLPQEPNMQQFLQLTAVDRCNSHSTAYATTLT